VLQKLVGSRGDREVNAAERVNQPEAPTAPVADRVVTVIVNYKSARHTITCLRSLGPELAGIAGAGVVVVENASGEGELLAAAISENGWEPWVSLQIADRNGGFAYGNNLAVRRLLTGGCAPQYFLLLNPDTEVLPGAVTTLLEFMDSRPDVGIAGCSYERGDGALWPIAFRFMTIWSELDRGLRLGVMSRLLKNYVVPRTMASTAAQVDWVAGACMMIRRHIFEEIGLLDEGYFLNYEDTDFCLRARRAGWPCWYVPQSRIRHIGGESMAQAVRDGEPECLSPFCYEARRRYFLKNHGLAYALAADLAYGIGAFVDSIRSKLQGKPRAEPQHLQHRFWAQSVVFKRNRSLDRSIVPKS
jgi:hypothetical protein